MASYRNYVALKDNYFAREKKLLKDKEKEDEDMIRISKIKNHPQIGPKNSPFKIIIVMPFNWHNITYAPSIIIRKHPNNNELLVKVFYYGEEPWDGEVPRYMINKPHYWNNGNYQDPTIYWYEVRKPDGELLVGITHKTRIMLDAPAVLYKPYREFFFSLLEGNQALLNE
jgi:hypothetical protein